MICSKQRRYCTPHAFDVNCANLPSCCRGVVAHELHQVLIPVEHIARTVPDDCITSSNFGGPRKLKNVNLSQMYLGLEDNAGLRNTSTFPSAIVLAPYTDGKLFWCFVGVDASVRYLLFLNLEPTTLLPNTLLRFTTTCLFSSNWLSHTDSTWRFP